MRVLLGGIFLEIDPFEAMAINFDCLSGHQCFCLPSDVHVQFLQHFASEEKCAKVHFPVTFRLCSVEAMISESRSVDESNDILKGLRKLLVPKKRKE